MLAKELINQGYNTIIVGIDSRNSLIELHNTVKTLKTFKAISTQIDKPVPLYYISQPSRSEADRQALFFINLMSLVIDKKRTAEFDNSDLKSFLYFNKTTANDPSVSVLEVHPNEVLVAEKNTSVVGTILVTTKKDATIHPVIPEYLATCVVTDKDYKNEDARLNAVLGKLSVIIEALDVNIKTLEDSKKINKIREVIVSDSNADGMVL